MKSLIRAFWFPILSLSGLSPSSFDSLVYMHALYFYFETNIAKLLLTARICDRQKKPGFQTLSVNFFDLSNILTRIFLLVSALFHLFLK